MKTITKIMVLSLVLIFLVSACTATPEVVTESEGEVVAGEQEEVSAGEDQTSGENEQTVSEEPIVEEEGIQFVDTTGKQVTLTGYPERIIVAGKATPYVLDTIYLFPDAAEKLAAIEVRGFDTQEFLMMVDPQVEVKNLLERDAGPEQIAPHQPDLVIVKNISLGQLGAALEEISIPVMGMNLETPEFFYEDIRVLGKVFDNEERAEAIVSYYQTIEAQIAEMMSGLTEEDRPTALVIQYSEDGGEVSFKVPPASYLQTTMIEKAGGDPVWLDADGGSDGWIQVGLEQIAVWDPELIFVVNYNGDSVESAQKLAESDTWVGLQAVENEKIFGFPADYASWDLIDPRWILGQQWLAAVIQPDLAAEIDLQSAVKSFYSEMYRLSVDQIEESVFPRLDELQ